MSFDRFETAMIARKGMTCADAALAPIADPRGLRALCATLALAAGLMAGVIGAAYAQDAAGSPLIVLPIDDGPALSEEAQNNLLDMRIGVDRRRAPRDETEAQADTTLVTSPLRPLHVSDALSGNVLRFNGERHVEAFSMFVADAAVDSELVLSMLSSVNVLPERSEARVSVNGTFVGALELSSFTEFAPARFEVPAGVLRAGHNEVQITTTQHHRIYCGPEASFALWSDIDLSRSGLVVADAAVAAGPDAFLMGLAAQSVQPSGIEIRGADGLGAQRGRWLSMVSARLSNVMAGAPLVYRFTPYWSVEGDAPARARVTFVPGREQRISFRVAADGAQVMVVEYRAGEAPEALPLPDTAFATRAPSPRPTLIDVDREVRLSEFGFNTLRVSQRYHRSDHSFRLPDDWLVLTAAKARIRFDYIYAQGLPEGAMLLLIVNNETIRMLPLRGEGGEYITMFPIDFEARLLRAGVNTLSFEVLLPGEPADLPCAASDGPVLEISDTSSLHVPYSPSMYLPDMGLAFNALGSESLRVNDLSARAYSVEDRIMLSAALARSGAGRAPAYLNLMALDDLGSVPFGDFTINRHVVEDVLLSGAEGAPGAGPAPEEEYNPFVQVRRTEGYTAAFSRIGQSLMDVATEASFWLFPRKGTMLEDWMAGQRGQAVLLQLDATRPDQIWMVRAPGSDMVQIASAMISGRAGSFNGPHGQVAVLDNNGQWQSWVAPDRKPVLLEGWSWQNARHAMGNFVSAQPISYVFGVFFIALISAALALRLIISTREHDT